MVNTTKRKSSGNKKPITSTDHVNEVDLGLSHSKQRRVSSAKTENESSTDSFSYSNCIHSDSERSSDSEFEEHPYSRSASQLNKRLHNNIPKPDLNSYISQLESNLKNNKRSRCTSKNAVMARLNRLKKKKYISDLENKNAQLEAENKKLKNMLKMRVREVESLKRKTLNLENVIRNSTEIGSLLKCVRHHTDLDISSSLLRSRSNDSPNNEVNIPTDNPSTSDGIHELDASPTEEEALVAVVLWGMALHSFCQPYKLRTSDIIYHQVQK